MFSMHFGLQPAKNFPTNCRSRETGQRSHHRHHVGSKGRGTPLSGGLIDFISKELPAGRTPGNLDASLNNIETEAAADAGAQQDDILAWPQSGGRRVKRKRKQTGGANGNRFLEYDCKIKTFVALYLTATYTDPPPSVSPDAAADGGGGGGDGVAAEGNDDATTYLQEKGILIPLQGGRYGYATSSRF